MRAQQSLKLEQCIKRTDTTRSKIASAISDSVNSKILLNAHSNINENISELEADLKRLNKQIA